MPKTIPLEEMRERLLRKAAKKPKDEDNAHEVMCMREAVYFTAVRTRPSRTRVEFHVANYESRAAAFNAAKASAPGDGRTMIYAVNEKGNSAHIVSV